MPNQTRNIATNTFTKGLIMDFDPTVTQNDRLVNALNATLLTFNGNEMTLQQDMGNGRVETAFLPEGYVPVGTCEFGDIIYIVSYNPLENKSQIGCFPSPERNITSDEISDLQQSLENSDFQEETNGTLTGVLNATSVKKIIYGNDNMNPGDKYVVYTDENAFSDHNQKTLTDFGNTAHKHDMWPKLLKLSVVAIEDSGKIVNLNSSVKWYDNDYYLNVVAKDEETPDIDSYRSAVSSAYSIFQSKVSGKLAILAELETIDGFSCAYDVYIKNKKTNSSDDTGDNSDTDENDTQYHIYFYTSWETSHNDVNPSGFLFTKSDWTTEEHGGQYYTPVYQGDGIVKYEYIDKALDLPIESAWTDSGWDYDKVREYNRIYKLDNPSITYEEYITSDSYNAQIDDIINWKKETEEDGTVHYRAVASDYDGKSLDPDQLRMVSKVSRLLNGDGEPYADEVDGGWKYVYNLDYIDDSDDEYEGYYTKLFNGEKWPLESIILTDDVVNNWFKKDIPTLITDTYELQREVTLNISDIEEDPVYQTFENDLSKLVWNYEVAPVMPYGVLDYMAIAGQIDFSKLGSGIIDLTTWRYYNSGNVSTLTWGFDAYTEPNKGIAEVVFDFFDNQGYAASWHTTGKTSYAGTFTDTIVLNQRFPSYKMSITDATGDNNHIHAGDEDADGDIYLTTRNRPVHGEDECFEFEGETLFSTTTYADNAGMLVSNCLYLVKITVKYCSVNILGEYDTDNPSDFRKFYRWYWTNSMFNDSYYSVQDFDVLQPRLELDFGATFDTTGKGGTNPLQASIVQYTQVENLKYSELTETDADGKAIDNTYKTLGATVYAINQNRADDGVGNILLTVAPVLVEAYDTFNMDQSSLNMLNVTCIEGESNITRDVESPSAIHTDDSYGDGTNDMLQPVDANYLCSHDNSGMDQSGYILADYGKNYCVVGDELYSLLGLTRVPGKTYQSQGDDARPDSENPTAGSTTTEIYSASDGYIAYLDSFSLNIYNDNADYWKFVNEDFTYTNANGESITVPHYQKYTISVDKIYTDTLGKVIDTDHQEVGTGIKLILAGTTYSKMDAPEYVSDPDSKMLRSVIHDATGEKGESSEYRPDYDKVRDQDSPDALGLRYHDGHMYFVNTVMLAGGKESSHHNKLGVSHAYQSEGRIFTGEDEDTGYSVEEGHEGKPWDVDFDSNKVQTMFKDNFNYNTSVNGCILGRMPEHDADAENIECSLSWKNIRDTFNLSVKNAWKSNCWVYGDQDQIPKFHPKNWNNTYYYMYTFAVYDNGDDLIVPFSDYFVGSGIQDRSTAGIDSSVATTLADMLGSFFSQLYVIDPSTATDGYVFKDLSYLQSYTEYWNKDLIFEIAADDEAKISDLITIGKQRLSDYLMFLEANSDYDEELISTYNIDIDLYGKQRLLQFQFAVNSRAEDLLTVYNQASESRNYITLSTITDGDSAQQVRAFTNNVIEDTLYTWDSSGAVSQFGRGSTLYYATKFALLKKDPEDAESEDLELCMVPNMDNIISNSYFSEFANVIRYNSGRIEWWNLSSINNYNSKYWLRWKHTGGGSNRPRVLQIPKVILLNAYRPS